MTPLRSVNAFVDEYGNTDIAAEKEGSSAFFIITAVLIDTANFEQQSIAAEKLRKKFFQTAEMKSSSVGDKSARRIRVLQAINELDIRTYTYVIDKRELYRDGGLANKGSFFKFLNRQVYERIYRVYHNVFLVADEHGREDFMKGFNDYIRRKLKLDLFQERKFRFAKSQSEVFLQVADFLSGSLARFFDPKKRSEQGEAFLQLVRVKSLGIEEWPTKKLTSVGATDVSANQRKSNDELIRAHCFRSAENFLIEDSGLLDDEDKCARIEVVNYLLFQAKFVNATAFISTAQILDDLSVRASIQITEHQFRSSIIAKLRDANVIIASSNRGYKIPVCGADMAEFVNQANTIIPPMLRRLRQARDDLHAASFGELDVLDGAELAYLRQLIELSA